LYIEKARLLSWGNAVGIARAANDGRNVILESKATELTIRSILENIRLLLTDSEKLRARYALLEVTCPQQSRARFDLVSKTSLSMQSPGP
jgi:hypothetical protein